MYQKLGDRRWRLGDWLVEYAPDTFIPTNFSWSITHVDYDGPGDRRHQRMGGLEYALDIVCEIEEDRREVEAQELQERRDHE